MDKKTWLIIILGLALIVSFIIKRGNSINMDKAKLNELHQSNLNLARLNDSIKLVNLKLDSRIDSIQLKVQEKSLLLTFTQNKLELLNKQRNEIHNHIAALDANGITNAFSTYLKAKDSIGNK